MKIYVAGPMRGIPNFNFPAFYDATARLRAAGHEVFNPAERDVERLDEQRFCRADGDESKVEGFSLREALAADLNWIALHADAIAVLVGFENSKGATAEVALGRALGLKIGLVEDFLYDGRTHG